MISACMIVQDEEECIARCLDNISPYFEEIIIIDGGSIDMTKEIITRYPNAKVFDIPFENDFGRQRNNAIEKASGDWIFIIDADEYCHPYVLERLEYLTTLDHDAYTFTRKTLINGILANPLEPDTTFRLFRSYCRYAGAMHESLTGFKNRKDTNMDIIHDKKAEWQQKDNEKYWDMGQNPPDGWQKVNEVWTYMYPTKRTELSALLCIYNEELMLRECLENLTQFADEIIVVDGGYNGISTDGSKAIIDEFIEQYPNRIKYYGGTFVYDDGAWNEPAQVNFGLSKVTKDYVMRTQPDLIYDIEGIDYLYRAMETGKKYIYCLQLDFWGDTKHMLLYKRSIAEGALFHQLVIDPLAVKMDCNFHAIALPEGRQFGMTADIDYNNDILYLPHVRKYHFAFVKPFKYQVEKTVTYAKCGLMGGVDPKMPRKDLYEYAINHVKESFAVKGMEYIGEYPVEAEDFRTFKWDSGYDEFMVWFESEFADKEPIKKDIKIKDFSIPTKVGYDDINLDKAREFADAVAWQLPAHEGFNILSPFRGGEGRIRDIVCAMSVQRKQMSMLDIGCGNAAYLAYYKRFNFVDSAFGIDISEKAIEHSKQTCKNNGISLMLFTTSIEEFDCSNKFDIIKMTEVIEHIINVPLALEKIASLLTIGGKFLGTAPKGNICDGQAHLHYFVDDELKNLLDQYFDIIEFDEMDFTGEGEIHYFFHCEGKK